MGSVQRKAPANRESGSSKSSAGLAVLRALWFQRPAAYFLSRRPSCFRVWTPTLLKNTKKIQNLIQIPGRAREVSSQRHSRPPPRPPPQRRGRFRCLLYRQGFRGCEERLLRCPAKDRKERLSEREAVSGVCETVFSIPGFCF